jgi:hypothetical protein
LSHENSGTVRVVVVRVVIALALFAVLAGVAVWLERRRRADAPTQATVATPEQLDRQDFPHPERPWLVALFTSSTCESCQGLYEKARPLESDDVAVIELEYRAARALHERYHVDVAPLTLVADHDGVVQASFVGAFTATDLWNAVAELRS